jgi:hypothetical protein
MHAYSRRSALPDHAEAQGYLHGQLRRALSVAAGPSIWMSKFAIAPNFVVLVVSKALLEMRNGGLDCTAAQG